ncbi:hypothetical protein LJ753_10975 [Arthrobacter sp. zg-Y20]|uniref:hypothetical protein n=1 Tax=unclassified Arthrobacter TaxID=235627 RepID=UPI001D13CC8D|nr:MULTISPECIES: hypothetical protein [unclassified Arthrobacter]MCC3276392.1 hypothetical protein [Arthrobacter sp. zg-Y20]MDK1316551.1 hypothetical protein [Arthrobacter sp. zg.Y20]WIB06591.1 hypothetical protein QNO06_02275 [Arthrobacter sp. zg-Y20]
MSARLEAAAKAAFVEHYGDFETWDQVSESMRNQWRNRVRPALAGADNVDPLRHPDEQTVEKAAEVLAKADGWLSLKHASPRHQHLLRERARTVVATLTEAG